MTERTWMSPVDGAWLRMDSATNPMVINAVLFLEGAVPHAEVDRLLRDRLLIHPRFRRRVADSALPGIPPVWEEDPNFDLANHVHRSGLPAPGDEGALAEMVGDIMSSPLPRDRPLWQVHHIEGLAGGSVLVARIHHAVGDGVALVKLLIGFTDEGPKPPPPKVGLPPEKGATNVMALASMAGAKAYSLGKMLALSADPVGPLKGTLGIQKKVAWSKAYDVAVIKRAAHARGAKLNDLVVATVGGALRSYLDQMGSQQDTLRALVPVYVPSHARGAEMGNHFGLVFLQMPVGGGDIESRIHESKRLMDDLKRAPDALVAMTVLGAMGLASEGIERIGIKIFTKKASMLLTNVPGPTEALHILGRRLSSVLVWAPVSGDVALGVSMLSYAGTMRMNVSADARVVRDPGLIVKAFEETFEKALAGA
ncbi:MAG: wax ester/triacylglycerol synthase family O-acyltransferase [Polyangiaceae bacterium]